MKLYALDIPDDPAMLPGWLEEHLMGLHLHQLVTELEVWRGPASDEPKETLDGILGQQRSRVVQTGLGSLSRVQLRQLLRHPQLLIELQRIVLEEGGDYWTTLPEPPEMKEMTARTFKKIQQEIRQQPGRQKGRLWLVALTSLATAAVLLIGVFSYEHWWRAPLSPVFAWSTPKIWPQAERSDYFNYLADQAERFWKAQPTATKDDLARGLGELRRGCSVLLVHEHANLGKEDQKWLRKKCLAWAEKLDQERQRLETDEDAGAVKAKVDGIVGEMVAAFRKQSQEKAG